MDGRSCGRGCGNRDGDLLGGDLGFSLEEGIDGHAPRSAEGSQDTADEDALAEPLASLRRAVNRSSYSASSCRRRVSLVRSTKASRSCSFKARWRPLMRSLCSSVRFSTRVRVEVMTAMSRPPSSRRWAMLWSEALISPKDFCAVSMKASSLPETAPLSHSPERCTSLRSGIPGMTRDPSGVDGSFGGGWGGLPNRQLDRD